MSSYDAPSKFPAQWNPSQWSSLTTVSFTSVDSRYLKLTGGTLTGNLSLNSGLNYQIGGTSVLSSTTLGSSVTSSSLTTVGTLASLNATTMTTVNATISGTLTQNINAQGYIRSGAQITDTTSLTQGAHVGWNNNLTGETCFVTKSGSASGGFMFYNSTGNNSTFSTGKTLLAQITSSGYLFATQPSFQIQRTGTWSVASDEIVTKGGTVSFERTPDSCGYNRSTGMYTVPVSGVWHFSLYLRAADGAGSLAMKPATTSAYSVQNSDNTFWVPADSGSRRTMTWSETISMSSGWTYHVYSGQATSIIEYIFCGHFIGN